MFLQRIVDADAGEPRPAAQPRPVDQHIEDRQQHDTREVGNQQPHRNRECLVIEQALPAMPLINISGTNTATVVRDELSIGVTTSPVPATQARLNE